MLKYILGLCMLAVAFVPTAFADIAMPTTTTVYFQMDGSPFEDALNYEVKCYGYNYSPAEGDVAPANYDPENPELVYSYSASCPEYGCEIDEPYYLNYEHTDYCDLEGAVGTSTFTIKNFANTPVPENCDVSEIGRTCSVTFDIPELTPAISPGEITISNAFPDVTSSNSFYDAVNYVESEGIVQGYEDGTYKPDIRINRAELTKIIIEATFDDSVINNCTPTKTYSDMPEDIWYAKYVCVASNNNIIQGYPDGTFGGDKYVNFVEASKIIVLGLGLDLGEGGEWYTPYVSAMEVKNAIPTSIDMLDKEITRGEMAELIYRLKQDITTKPSVTLL